MNSSMMQYGINQKTKKSNRLIILVSIVVLMAVVCTALFIYWNGLPISGGISGRYEFSTAGRSVYFDFKRDSTGIYTDATGVSNEITYSLSGDQITVANVSTGVTMRGTVSGDKQEIAFGENIFMKNNI
jgi:flagellar basal body-associated protein FliL